MIPASPTVQFSSVSCSRPGFLHRFGGQGDWFPGISANPTVQFICSKPSFPQRFEGPGDRCPGIHYKIRGALSPGGMFESSEALKHYKIRGAVSPGGIFESPEALKHYKIRGAVSPGASRGGAGPPFPLISS